MYMYVYIYLRVSVRGETDESADERKGHLAFCIHFVPSLFSRSLRFVHPVRECKLLVLRRLRLLDGIDGNCCGLHGACFLWCAPPFVLLVLLLT